MFTLGIERLPRANEFRGTAPEDASRVFYSLFAFGIAIGFLRIAGLLGVALFLQPVIQSGDALVVAVAGAVCALGGWLGHGTDST